MVQTVQKNIRVTPEQWERIEKAADERGISANQLLVELAMEALDGRQWPRTEANPSPALRNVHRTGHGARHGGGRTRRRDRRNRAHISKIAPELPPDSSDDTDEGG